MTIFRQQQSKFETPRTAKNQSERREAFKNKNTPKKKQQNCNWKKPTNCAHLSKKRIFLESMLNNFKQQKKKKKRNTHSHTLNNNTFFCR